MVYVQGVRVPLGLSLDTPVVHTFLDQEGPTPTTELDACDPEVRGLSHWKGYSQRTREVLRPSLFQNFEEYPP